jgi:DNA-binding NarL/FixJ family response regulator
VHRERLLIVDDNEKFCHGLAAFVHHFFECLEASTATQAKSFLKESSIDVVLLDLTLPDVDGTPFIHRIRKDFPSVPVVMFATEGYDLKLMKEAMDAGAKGYLSKDAGVDNIVLALKNALRYGHEPPNIVQFKE